MGEDLYKKQMLKYKKEFIKIRYDDIMSEEEKRTEIARINELVTALKKAHVKSSKPRMEPNNRAANKRETKALWDKFEEEER